MTTTPVLQTLVAEFADACERARAAYLADIRPHAVRLGQLDVELDTLRARLRWQTADADRLAQGPGEDWLAVRYPGEEPMADVATRERRSVTHRQLYVAARAGQHATQADVDARLAEQADLRARVGARADVLRSQVVRFQQLAEQKAALYRQALIKRHPQRSALVERWTTRLCDPPAWATDEMPLPTPEPTGAPA